MLITAQILLIFFGLFAVWSTVLFVLGSSLSWVHALLWFFSVIVTAISAGVVWGGLLSNVG